MTSTIIIVLCVAISILFLAKIAKGQCEVENYRDLILLNKKKMYEDYYPRANGSIYGTYYQPWSMFSGYPLYDKAY